MASRIPESVEHDRGHGDMWEEGRPEPSERIAVARREGGRKDESRNSD